MKHLILTFALILGLSAAALATDPKAPIKCGKSRSLLIFRTTKANLGGKVEIYNEKGELVQSTPIAKKRMVIDFASIKSGKYSIRINKDCKTKVIEIEKTDAE